GSTTLDGSTQIYWYVFTVFLAVVGVMYLIDRSPFGRTIRGIRDNERRMRSLGYGTNVYKYVAFCMGGVVAGIGGATWVAHTQFIAPGDLGIRNSALLLVALAVGGSGRLWGPFVGAAVVIATQNLLPSSLVGQSPLVLGALLVLSVYLLPGGIAACPQRFRRFRRSRRLRRFRQLRGRLS
ncbi:MAG: branched-chain amino acid ABC transporter permease, partial [Steroidobacteraceae bacterium]